MLICPNCGSYLERQQNCYRCAKGHSFDIAREGYVNLLLKHSANPGDDNLSITSRNDFLNKGYYQPLALALQDTVSKYLQPGQSFLDAGCGTGYYLSFLTKQLDLEYYATDISKKAVALTSKKNKQAACFVGNVFHLPLEDESLDALMSVFTPYSAAEFGRVIKTGGYVIAVTPGKRHLYQLKQIVYENPYYNEEKGYDLPQFELKESFNVTYQIHLENRQDICSLWRMMPYYHTTSKEDNDKLLTKERADTTIDFLINVYQKVNGCEN